MGNLIDITREVHGGMAIYPNNPRVGIERVQEAGEGKNALSRMEMGTHTGTHIDAPAHIHADGAGGASYPLSQLIGECQVVDVSHLESVITTGDIPETAAERVLFKTCNSASDVNYFDDNFVALDDSAAEECVRRGLTLVGLDALSIRKRGTKNQVHETLIDNDVVVLEGLWLKDVKPGRYELLCLPLKVDSDGAPVRAVLRAV